MNMKLIAYRYIMALGMIIASFIGIKQVVSKDDLIEITIFTIVDVDELMKHKDIINIILRVIIVVMCILAYLGYIIPTAKDLPRVMNNDFCTIEGVSLEKSDYDDSEFKKNILVKDNEGNKHRISCDYNEEINTGDILKIVYLPNTKIGSVIEHKKTN